MAKDKALRDDTVTITDVLAVCPRPMGVSKKAHSYVFKDELFKPVGYTRALNPEANGHVIRVWALANTMKPLAERSFRGVEYDRGD